MFKKETNKQRNNTCNDEVLPCFMFSSTQRGGAPADWRRSPCHTKARGKSCVCVMGVLCCAGERDALAQKEHTQHKLTHTHTHWRISLFLSRLLACSFLLGCWLVWLSVCECLLGTLREIRVICFFRVYRSLLSNALLQERKDDDFVLKQWQRKTRRDCGAERCMNVGFLTATAQRILVFKGLEDWRKVGSKISQTSSLFLLLYIFN